MSKEKVKLNNSQLIIFVSIIAVLCVAILAICVGLTAKIKIATDEALLTKVNACLEQTEKTEGKNQSIHEAILDAKKAGYNISEINKSNEYQLVWDQDSDRFIMVNSEGKLIAGNTNNMGKKARLWQTYSAMPEKQTFSIYANDDFSPRDNLLISVGFDTGDNKDFGKLTYTAESRDYEVMIVTGESTSCTELVIYSENALIAHYGKLECIEIKSVGKNGYYHEYGQVNGILSMSSGIVSMEKNCDIQQLVVEKTATRDTLLEIKAQANVDMLVVDSAIAQVKARTDANISVIVADLGTANISVDPRINAEEIVKEHISSENELKEALSANKKYIVLDNSFSLTSQVEVSYNLCIDGNGKTITSNMTRGAFIFVTNSNVELFIKNLNYADANIAQIESYNAFLIIGSGNQDLSGIKVWIYNVNAEVKNECIVINNNTSANLSVLKNSKIKGNCAILCVGYNCDICVSSSLLESKSISNYSAGAIVIESYNVDMVITNSKIVLKTVDLEESALYAVFITNYSAYVNVELNSCSYDFSGDGVEKLYSQFSKAIRSRIIKDGTVVYAGE